MLMKLGLLAFTFFSFGLYSARLSVSAKLQGTGLETNARRLAAGLPPLPPSKRWSPTEVHHARRADTSPLPLFPISGRVRITRSDGVSGYIAVNSNANSLYLFTPNLANAATFASFVYATGPINHVNVEDISTGFLGALSGSYALHPDNTGTASIRRVAAAQPPGTYGSGTETAIWTYDPSSGSLTAQYVNPDGSEQAASILLVPPSNYFQLTANPSGVIAANNPTRIRVTFTFELIV